jgi:hypothetical protein
MHMRPMPNGHGVPEGRTVLTGHRAPGEHRRPHGLRGVEDEDEWERYYKGAMIILTLAAPTSGNDLYPRLRLSRVATGMSFTDEHRFSAKVTSAARRWCQVPSHQQAEALSDSD